MLELYTSSLNWLKFLFFGEKPPELRADPSPPAARFHVPADGALNRHAIAISPGYMKGAG